MPLAVKCRVWENPDLLLSKRNLIFPERVCSRVYLPIDPVVSDDFMVCALILSYLFGNLGGSRGQPVGETSGDRMSLLVLFKSLVSRYPDERNQLSGYSYHVYYADA